MGFCIRRIWWLIMFTADGLLTFSGPRFFYKNRVNLTDLQILLTSACYFSNLLPLFSTICSIHLRYPNKRTRRIFGGGLRYFIRTQGFEMDQETIGKNAWPLFKKKRMLRTYEGYYWLLENVLIKKCVGLKISISFVLYDREFWKCNARSCQGQCHGIYIL